MALLLSQVYYITCPETTVNFARFPTTPTGREVTVIEQATGKCVDNAEEVETPTYLCKGDGKWYLPTGGCKCKAGFEADVEKQTCNGEYEARNSKAQSLGKTDIPRGRGGFQGAWFGEEDGAGRAGGVEGS